MQGAKNKKNLLKVGPVGDPEQVEKMIEELWPKFRRGEPKFSKLYDWDADFPYLEDLRLISNERIGFGKLILAWKPKSNFLHFPLIY